MSAIDAYGDFELPEEKSTIEVVENPVKAVISTHEICKKIFEKATQTKDFLNWGDNDEFNEQVYISFMKTFEGKENLKADTKQTQEILEYLKNNDLLKEIEPIVFTPSEYALQKALSLEEPTSFGIFLSALQNATKLDTIILEEFPYIWHAGYKLKKNKYLIIGPKTGAFRVGTYGEGTIINKGDVDFLGKGSQKGIYINNERTGYFGWDSNGLYINNKNATEIGFVTQNGIVINNGKAHGIGYEAQDGIIINNGKSDYVHTDNLRKQAIDLTPKQPFLTRILNFITRKRVSPNPLKQKLDSELTKIEFTKTLDELPYEEQMNKVKTFDWKTFEKEITAIAEEIQEEHNAYRKSYK